jgi:hypothetical protein
MDASQKKAFSIKVRALTRTLKEYRNYKLELEGYNLNEVSQDKKKHEFYIESKSALEDVEKRLIEYYMQLKAYMVSMSLIQQENEEAIQGEEEASVKADLQAANAQIQEVQTLLPAAC